MANPKKHHSASRRDSRRAHWKRLANPGISKCAQCIAHARIASALAVVFIKASCSSPSKRRRKTEKDKLRPDGLSGESPHRPGRYGGELLRP